MLAVYEPALEEVLVWRGISVPIDTRLVGCTGARSLGVVLVAAINPVAVLTGVLVDPVDVVPVVVLPLVDVDGRSMPMFEAVLVQLVELVPPYKLELPEVLLLLLLQ
jgi:hypothetical protein